MEQSRKHDPVPTLKGMRVLVVEDDAILLLELETILMQAGAEIVGLCRTVNEALRLTAKDGPTCAILDVRLGRETVAPVARLLARRGTPFVFYTGQVDNDPALAEWSDRKIVSKPAQPTTIVRVLLESLQ